MPEGDFYNSNISRAYPFTYASTLAQGANYDDALFVDAGLIISLQNYDNSAVSLTKIRRDGTVVLVEFTILGQKYDFSFDTKGDDYFTELTTFDSPNNGCAPVTGVEIFVTTGRWSAWESLPDATDIDFTLLLVEPANVQNLANTFVTKIAVANMTRTRATVPPGCDELVFATPGGIIQVVEDCITGDIRFDNGVNSVVRQDEFDNAIEFVAAAGIGADESCNELEFFPDEAPPPGRTTLDGSLRCEEVLRSINGVSIRLFEISAGPGAVVLADPENSTLTVDVDMSQLSICLSQESIDEFNN